MRRKMYDKLLQWKERSNGKSALLIQGARRVGKSYIVEEFAESEYDSYILIDFNKADEQVKDIFLHDLDNLNSFFLKLTALYGVRLHERRSLVVLDEVQLFPRARSAVKYLVEDGRYDYIETGSLISIRENVKDILIPSEEDHMNMYPMDFEEYLWAKGKELLADMIRTHYEKNQALGEGMHKEALAEYYNYCIIGGMPAAIAAETMPYATLTQEEIRHMLLDSYIADMAKYALPSETVKIFATYDSLPSQLAKDSKKFQYKLIKSGARASQYGDSIDWLIRAGIVNKCVKCTQGFMPPSAFLDLTAFKLYYSDTGIMSARTGMNLVRLMGEEAERFRGIFAENYVACVLRANGYELLYWESDGTAEVDFLIIKDDHVIPVECKSGNHVKSRSLAVYREKYHPAYSIRISARNFGMADEIKSVPLYAAFCI